MHLRQIERGIAIALPAVLMASLLGPAAAAAPPPSPDALAEKALAVIAQEQPESLAVTGRASISVTITEDEGIVRTADGDLFTVRPSDSQDSVLRRFPDGIQAMTVLRDGERSTAFHLDLPH